MGFIRANMIPILDESRRRRFSGKLLLLGQGDIYFNLASFEAMARAARVELDSTIPVEHSYIASFRDKGYLSCGMVFRMLGFDEINVLDVSKYQGADMLYDLNKDDLPVDCVERFDVVIDHGTLEHVFHLPNALNNIFKLLKVGGRVIHTSPSNNYLDHGFYMFQPTLFVDYYSANNWSVEMVRIARFNCNQETEPPFFAEYEQGMFDGIGNGKMGGDLFSTICVATKTSTSSSAKIPQQGWYARLNSWGSER